MSINRVVAVTLSVCCLALSFADSAAAYSASSDLGPLVYEAAQKMTNHLPKYVARTRPIVVTTMVSVDDLNKSSSFGRISSQLILDRLVQNGYTVTDVTYMRGLATSPTTGETVLSRDAQLVSQNVNAQAVVTGTYAVGGQMIYLTIRMLDAGSGTVLSTSDVEIPLDYNTRKLVAEAGTPIPAELEPFH